VAAVAACRDDKVRGARTGHAPGAVSRGVAERLACGALCRRLQLRFMATGRPPGGCRSTWCAEAGAACVPSV